MTLMTTLYMLIVMVFHCYSVGMLMADCAKMEDVNQLLRLWHHENCRVFRDRLVNDEDREWFSGYLEEKITKDFGCKIDEVNPRQPMLYGDFMIANVDNMIYAEITDQEKVKEINFFL